MFGEIDRLRGIITLILWWEGSRFANLARSQADIKAGLTVWEVGCKPALNYGAKVWACSSKTYEVRLEQIQDRAGRRVLDLTWCFSGVVVRGESG